MTQVAKSILKNSIYNSSGILISKIGGLIFVIILARLLSPELFGIYYLALSIGFLLLTFTDLGINGALVRYVSYASGKGEEALGRTYFLYLGKLKLLLTFISSVLIMFLAKPLSLYVFHKPLLFLPLEIIGLFIFLQSILGFITSAFVAFQRFEYPTIGSGIYEGLRLLLAPLFILIGYSVFGALTGLSLAVLVTIFVLFYFLIRKYPFLLKGKVTKIDRRRVLRFLSYLTIGSISGIFFAYIDSIMLGIFMAAEYVGFYQAAYNIVFAVVGIIGITGVLFPVFTRMEGMELKNAFDKVFKYSTILSFPFAFGLAFIAAPFVKVVYGAEYLSAILPMYVLSLLIMTSATDFFGVIFSAKEKPEYPAKVTIVAAALNVILNYVLILRYGMVGAAIATVISRYFYFTLIWLLSQKVLGIYPDLSSIYKPLFSSLMMVAFLYLAPRPDTILIGMGEILVAGIIYISIMFLIRGIEKEDIKYLSVIVGQEERLIRAYNIMNSKLQRGGK